MKCRHGRIGRTAPASNQLIYGFPNYFPPDE